MKDHFPVSMLRYSRYRQRLRASRAVHFPNDVVFQDHIRQGDLEQVGRFIRARKVALDTIYPSGTAALHQAVLTGNLDCVKLLVKYGADIQQRDEHGWTALHMACSDGHADIARYLLSLGASLEATTDDGEKPSDLIDPEYKELVELFQAATMD
ncbi:protein phosphatase 1 regulatory subunit 27 [Excalfactoria chinensis]|uniref:protein phosphatase 1 regulatory subunit 27 n=1 Tax=Excalfactoria chinensis TaxID=46218 RepID=UPI003B3B2B0A